MKEFISFPTNLKLPNYERINFKFSLALPKKLALIGAVQFYNRFNYSAEITATWQCLS
jgi:hypothetical protein